jgi:hypothetical protein
MNRLALYATIALACAGAPFAARAQQSINPSVIKEHMEVISSDGQHIGTVDKVEGDLIALTRNDPAAGGQHHTIPLTWASSIAEQKLMLNQTAQAARSNWRTASIPPADKK